ncbi:DUF4133 domain-containing protein [Myroides pelagicus]|uniref:DUF4133 domain-containing protein n=1 Tax=Myroides pelagicus TaxID=270914 RepID=A0A7K1GQ26_9FLAO|nr:DUF4133 domain-containing protein [Myroides pelagicus]MEC4113422.1 DUF4133 domain-containing protein [Myroides pelagicus]MTH30493.1 DUF4133 domain-containing protein [Myroides pelagicus]
MVNYSINKGIGSVVEFKGLRGQYLIYFALGLILNIVLIIVGYLSGGSIYVCLFIGFVLTFGLSYFVFLFNKKYGQYGLVKLRARATFPKYILNRKPISEYLNLIKTESYEK